MQHPVSPRQLAWLSGHCGAPLQGPPFVVNRTARFSSAYRQYLRLLQPQAAVLAWLAKRDDALLTYVEVAQDVIMPGEDELCAFAEQFNRSFVQHRHRSRQMTIFENGNARSGARTPGVTFQWYSDRHSKLTGEVDCFHFEARVSGSKAIKRHGFTCGNLSQVDLEDWFARLWSSKAIGLYRKDLERLGRWLDNRRKRTRRRASIITDSGYNEDLSRGCIAYRAVGSTAQGLIDSFGRGPFVYTIKPTFDEHAHEHVPELVEKVA
ncbi:hypothetical protein [Methyloceanibacter sp. wino2]|uniref:hypothetical protein n=1 Tax=Methyloceanibacter sp. wino2 TaxID=2170729 RepID=UPI000D3E71E9|nr:hypothetical protein [Methyloceanibacter sp. wino2]